ncbi:MAG: hypothetical protein JO279_16970 [Verrucomicrobia bacterium]|nr:hypothetical protein [Verrucomicrobiota bacterium]
MHQVISADGSSVTANRLQRGVLLLILSIPSLYVFLLVPPLWRDSDGFNEIAGTFAPMGIIHWLPAYCLGGRLIVFGGSIAASLMAGHGIPNLSISNTPLSDAGIYTLILVQHLFLIFSLFYAVTALSDHFKLRASFAVLFALTPWLYIYANCVGTEAFSNPLVYLIAACGWNCLRAPQLNKREIIIYFGLLLTAALTRQINAVLPALLPIALLPLAGKELLLHAAAAHPAKNRAQYRYTQRFLIFLVVGLSAIGSSLLVQKSLCWLFRVPFRSTFGETFEWRLSYLQGLSKQDRDTIVAGIIAKANDPIITEALDALSRSLDQGEKWADMFLINKINEILLRAGTFKEMQLLTWQRDLKLNRIAMCVLFSGEPHFISAVWADFGRSLFITQTELASPPFILTDFLHTELPDPKLDRLRGIASFQHPEGYYEAVWNRVPYFHLFDRIPMLVMGGLTITFSGLALLGAARDPLTLAGVSHAAGMIVTGLLISGGTCLSAGYAARFHMPVFSLLQMSMLLAVSVAARVLSPK